VRAPHRRNRFGWPAHLDLRRALAPKEIQQQFTRRPAKPRQRPTGSNRHPLAAAGPLDLEPAAPEPPAQEPPTAAHVSPQPGIHRGREPTNPQPIGTPHVLVMDEALVEVRHLAHPRHAEEPDRRPRPDSRDQPRKVRTPGQSNPTPLGKPPERTGQNEARTPEDIMFALHEVGGEIVGRPAVEQRGNRRAELVEKIAQLNTFLRVERDVTHEARVYERLW
jgi:hypothetical protein